MKRGDPKNGIAVHVHESNHTIDLRTQRILRQCLMSVKTTTPQDRRKGVVYKIPCKECGKC